MISLNFQGKISGAGSPNYLDGAYDVDVATIGGNKIAAVVSFDDASLSLFNIDDPENPTLTDSIQGTGSPNYLNGASKVRLVEISSTWYAVITSYLDNALTIFNVNNPASISHTGEIIDGGGSSLLEGAYGLDIATISSTVYAFVTALVDDALVVVNINTPASPSESDNISGAGTPNYLDGAHGVVVAQQSSVWYAFVVSYFDNALSVFNVNNPASISLSGAVTGEGSPNYLGGAHSIDHLVVDTTPHVFITSYGEDTFVIYDVSTPASPSYVSRLSEGQDPYYLEEPTGIKALDIGGNPMVFIAGYLDDSIVAFDVADTSDVLLASVVRGADSPYYLGGTHGLYADEDNLLITSYNEDTLVIFDIDLEFIEVSVSMDAVTDISAGGMVGGEVWVATSMNATTYIRAGEAVSEVEWDDFWEEIKKPHWYPIVQVLMLDNSNKEVDVTDKVADYDRVLWQIEQQYKINEFTANNCRLSFRNENEEFDVDNASNFFVTELSRSQDGYRTPVLIKVGYRTKDDTLLIPLFYGLLVDIDTATSDDMAHFDLQCISRILRDSLAENIGGLWADQRLYGGHTYTYTTVPINAYTPYIAASGDSFPDGFPPCGYIRIEDEIIYYGTKSTDGFGDCLRGRHGTTPAEHFASTYVALVMHDGSDTEERFFQFPVYPISQGSVVSVTSSDGNITLYDKEVLLNVAYEDRKTTGFVDYDNGILELAGEPTDSSSLVATYKTCPRNMSYSRLAKMLLESKAFSTALVEDSNLTNYLGVSEPINYGRITHAWYGTSFTALPGLNAFALCSDSSGNVYIGVGSSIIKWDGEQYTLLADLGSDNEIFRLDIDSNGNIYGICGPEGFELDPANKLKHVFKYDGVVLTFLATDEACYLHFASADYDSYGIDGAQWKGFSIDETNSCVWYLYRVGNLGIAKVSFSGGTPTRYARPGATEDWKSIDMVDTGSYIEFFYQTGSGVQYDRFNKAGSSWSSVGLVYSTTGDDYELPYIVGYNSNDGKIYYNILLMTEEKGKGKGKGTGEWRGGFYSVPVNSATETLIESYSNTDTRWDRYTGGVYYDDYLWFGRGTSYALGQEIDPRTGEELGDQSTGHLYRIDNNVIEDMGAVAYRPLTTKIVYLRDNVKGYGSVLTIRPTDGAIFYIASDATVSFNEMYGYSFGVYNSDYIPVVKVANFNNRTIWDCLSELATLINYELGVSKDGVVFWRRRVSGFTQLAGDINDTDATITSDGSNISLFDTDGGLIQIREEVIAYTSRSGNTFSGCSRGYYGSTAMPHEAPETIWKIRTVITNEMAHESTLKWAKKTANLDDVFNYIEVPYGELLAVFDWEKAGETWEESSEYRYGKKLFRVDNQFLTNDDGGLAEAISWRYYNSLNRRRGLLELETKWQPQLDLGDMVSVRQDTRTLLNFTISNIRRIEVIMGGASERFFVRILALIRPSRYRSDVYEYDYEGFGF